jgi:hypothetical protein
VKLTSSNAIEWSVTKHNPFIIADVDIGIATTGRKAASFHACSTSADDQLKISRTKI